MEIQIGVDSIGAAASPAPGPDKVPLPNRRPGCRSQPFTRMVGDHMGDGPIRVLVTGAAVRCSRDGGAYAWPASAGRPSTGCRWHLARGWPRHRDRAAAGPRRGPRDPVRSGASASSLTTQGDRVVTKFFERKRAQWLVLPGLQVPCRTIAQQADAGHVVLVLRDANARARPSRCLAPRRSRGPARRPAVVMARAPELRRPSRSFFHQAPGEADSDAECMRAPARSGLAGAPTGRANGVYPQELAQPVQCEGAGFGGP